MISLRIETAPAFFYLTHHRDTPIPVTHSLIAIGPAHSLQEQEEYHLRVYVGICVASERTKRHPLKAQRDLADIAQHAAQQQLGTSPPPSLNRTHSRGIAAAVLSDEIQPLGIDIEYADTRRNWPEILSVFCDSADLTHYSIHALNRGWTFLEAYYKAFAKYPSANAMLSVISKQFEDGKTYSCNHEYACLHQAIETDFYMTIIWKPISFSAIELSAKILPIIYKTTS